MHYFVKDFGSFILLEREFWFNISIAEQHLWHVTCNLHVHVWCYELGMSQDACCNDCCCKVCSYSHGTYCMLWSIHYATFKASKQGCFGASLLPQGDGNCPRTAKNKSLHRSGYGIMQRDDRTTWFVRTSFWTWGHFRPLHTVVWLSTIDKLSSSLGYCQSAIFFTWSMDNL